MTRFEAEQSWDTLKGEILAKLNEHSLEAPNEAYITHRHQAFIFDQLSGEFTVDPMMTGPGRLQFWHEKLKAYRLTGNNELTSYILGQIQEVLHGV